MAGIGFELKKLFKKKSLFSLFRAYGYAGVVCMGPMILGFVLLFCVFILGDIAGIGKVDRDLLTCMITYTMLASMIVTNTFSMITTRYVSDCLYENKKNKIMPSFLGSIMCMLVLGDIMYGIFLGFSGVNSTYKFLCIILFNELIIVWSQLNYLSAIKDYKGIFKVFFASLLVSIVIGFTGVFVLKIDVLTSLMLMVIFAYGVMIVWYYVLLIRYFPVGSKNVLHFLTYLDKYPSLIVTGFSLTMGLFLHIVIMWTSPFAKQIKGLFYSSVEYDMSALFAFLSIILLMVNFITSVEVNFYDKYKNYFALLNGRGTLKDIEEAEYEMKTTLLNELGYIFSKQFFVTLVFVLGGTILIPKLPLGFTSEMIGTFRTLCVGYAFYGIGNCIMLCSLYFSDNKGAVMSTTSFFAVSSIVTYLLKDNYRNFYGFGFLVGGVVFTFVAIIRLCLYLNKIEYHILCSQPIIERTKKGFFTNISLYFEKRYEDKLKSKNKEA